MALVEQTNAGTSSSGQIDLLTANNATNPTSFSAYSHSTLARNGTTPSDIDNPQSMIFDANGDLLIANGGAGNPDYGNFSCIPAGSVAAGASTNATILQAATANLNDPNQLALGTDNSVALTSGSEGMISTSQPDPLNEFVLNPTYTLAPASRSITANGFGAVNVIALPASGANPSGTYAVSLSNGANPPQGGPTSENPTSENTPGNQSEILIKYPSGATSAVISDNNTTLAEPDIAYDASTGYIVAASGAANNNSASATGTTAYLNTYSATTYAKISSQVIRSNGDTPVSSDFGPNVIAVSSSGYIAVAGVTESGNEIVQVWKDVSGGTPTIYGAPIPLDGTTTPGGSTVAFDPADGSNAEIFVPSLRFLSPTKLLIAVRTGPNGTADQGFYLYDVSTLSTPQTQPGQPCSGGCYNDQGAQYGAGPTYVTRYLTSNHPLVSAYIQ